LRCKSDSITSLGSRIHADALKASLELKAPLDLILPLKIHHDERFHSIAGSCIPQNEWKRHQDQRHHKFFLLSNAFIKNEAKVLRRLMDASLR
jgi:hypothetical protein